MCERDERNVELLREEVKLLERLLELKRAIREEEERLLEKKPPPFSTDPSWDSGEGHTSAALEKRKTDIIWRCSRSPYYLD